MYQKIDMYSKEGWSYVAFNFQTDAVNQVTKVWGYMATSDQCTVASTVYTLPGPLVDDNKFIV